MKKLLTVLVILSSISIYAETTNDDEVTICPEEAPIRCDINDGCCPTDYPLCGWFDGEVRCYDVEE